MVKKNKTKTQNSHRCVWTCVNEGVNLIPGDYIDKSIHFYWQLFQNYCLLSRAEKVWLKVNQGASMPKTGVEDRFSHS